MANPHIASASLSARDARRLALAAQGLPRGSARRGRPTKATVLELVRRQGLLQLDSVNILARAHYLPVFSRLGPYDRSHLDTLAYDHRELYEGWSHEACLLPVEFWPLHAARRAADQQNWLRRLDRARLEYIDRVLDEVADRGPITAGELSDPGTRRAGSWWNRSAGKSALEYLFVSGRLAIADRRSFERVYDLAERVLPGEVLAAPQPAEHEARRLLVQHAAGALGVATVADLADYFRFRKTPTKAVVAELVAEGVLEQVTVEGWTEPAYVRAGVVPPRRVAGRAVVSPFDPIVWCRPRTERLFGFRYRIEIYTPAAKRVHGYYVLPFVLGEDFVARVDLKADRAARVLRVAAAWIEPGAGVDDVGPELAAELATVAAWLELDAVDVADRGDLAGPLRAAVAAASVP